MPAYTPIYGLAYLVAGEPARNTRTVLQSNAETIETALAAGGVAAAGASDVLAVSGRVTALETRHTQHTAASTPAVFAANSAAVTAETVIATFTQPTTALKKYRIRAHLALVGTVAGDRHFMRIRKTNLTGTVLASFTFLSPSAAGTAYTVDPVTFDTPAAATTSSTWVLTVERFGTGTVRTEVTTPGPAWIEVERVN
jgi:hypothetical protein